MTSIVRPLAAMAAALALFAAAGMAAALELSPADPQPEPAALAPGLAVDYVFGMFENVDDFKDRTGEAGQPVAVLDAPEGKAPVLTSGLTSSIAARLRGYIEFPAAGTWRLRARSNDGIRLWVAGRMVLQDPGYHNARWLDPVELAVPAPGWYAFAADYFQRGGMNGIQVEWAAPGGELTVVPAEAYAHTR